MKPDQGTSAELRCLRAEVAALRAREEQLDAALAAWDAGTFRWEIAADRVTWDDNLRRVFALPEGREVRTIGDFLALVHPEDREAVVDGVQAALQARRDLDMEFRIVRGDGAVRWLADRGRLLLDGQGQPAAVIGACIDVTARRLAEERRRESEERYRSLVETSPDAIFVHQDGLIVFANRQAAAMLGAADAASLVGSPVFDLVAPEFRELARQRVARVPRPGMRNEPTEFLVRRLDGRTVQVETTSASVLVDGRLAVQVALRDITGRKAAEAEQARLVAALDAERARLHAILEHMPAGVLIREAPGGALVLSNEQLRRIWRGGSVLPGQDTGSEYLHGFHHDGRPYEPSEWPLMRAIATGETVLGEEIEILRGDGTRGVISVNAAPVTDGQGRRIAGVVVVDDITARREVEQRQRLLSAELSHRVKNTLAVVRSIARQSLAGDRSLEDARQALDSRLLALGQSHDLLTASGWRGVDLEDLVRGELLAYGGRARVRGARVLLTPKATQTLGLVLHELATNAAKYGALSVPGGSVTVEWNTPGRGLLELRWEEQGGPPVGTRHRCGFGRTLIERALAYELGGSATLSFAPAGVTCELRMWLGDRETPAKG
ncbi:PAS domain S-box protein [Geminicoccaceae bacterium 1502E]|nr:PAS domain S-box protein [Geminicoccaceae bacterium 1502E]